MIALVTGATGFIGSHLVKSLLEKGFTVRILIRKTSNLRWLQGLGVESAVGDLCQGNFPTELLRGVDYVFHLAGVIEAVSRKDYFETNAEGTRRLLQALARIQPGLKKFLFVSSQSAGGPSRGERGVREDDPPHPVSFYGASKLAAEKYVLEFASRFPVVILRPPTIYGPRETRVLAAFKMINRGFILAVSREPKFISFCYVGDLVEALHQAASMAQADGKIYNVCGPRPYEWLEFVEAIARALKRSYRVVCVPKPLLLLWGAGGEIYSRLSRHSTLFTWQKVKEFVQNSWAIDGSRIRDELEWREKVSLEEGIAKTAEWYLQAGWL